MTAAIDLSIFEIQKHRCQKNHESRRNRWIGNIISDLCLDCNGKDRTLKALESGLKAKIIPAIDPFYDSIFEIYPKLRDPRNLRYLCTCFNGHSWESTLGDILTGRWCEWCLLDSTTINVQKLDRLARGKKGRCLSSGRVTFDMHSRQQFICTDQNLFYEYPIEIIYGKWCERCYHSATEYKGKKLVLDDAVHPQLLSVHNNISLTKTDWLSACGPEFTKVGCDDSNNVFTITVSDWQKETKVIVDYNQIKNPAHVIPIRCKNGHIGKTAPMLHHPNQWCHRQECNGTDGALEIMCQNMEAKYELDCLPGVNSASYPECPEFEKEGWFFKFECKLGHKWSSSAKAAFDGLWCDQCLTADYPNLEDYKRLAATFGGNYQIRKSRHEFGRPVTKFICPEGSEIQRDTVRFDRLSSIGLLGGLSVELSVLRGARCTEHEKCIKIAEKGLLDPIAREIVARSEMYTPVETKIKGIRELDQSMDLTTEQMEDAIKKYPKATIKVVYLRAKYNTISKLVELAESRNGGIVDEMFSGFSFRYTWECSKCQFNGINHRWKEDLNSILFGSWCRVCQGDTNRNLSKGNLAVRRFLDSKGLKYIPEYSYEDCRYINPLRFDLWLPELNLHIEFDGCQHFAPVEFWGGEETFRVQLEKDNIKANYCRRNKRRLIRITDKNMVDEHLTSLMTQLPNHVMYICTPPGYVTAEPGYTRQADEKYTVIDFSLDTSP